MAAAALLLLLAVSPAQDEEARWHLAGEAVQELPLFVGGRVTLESPSRLRFSVAAATIPPPHLAALSEFMVAAGAYDELEAELIGLALGTPLQWRLQAGWRPLPERGAYFELGYGVVTLGGGVATGDLVDRAAALVPDLDIRGSSSLASSGHALESTLHMLSLEVGYQWAYEGGLLFRIAAGYSGTLASSTAVSAAGPGYGVNEFTTRAGELAAFLDELYPDVVHLPSFSIAVGYRLAGPVVVR